MQFNKPSLREQALYLNLEIYYQSYFFIFQEKGLNQAQDNYRIAKLIENRNEIKDKYDEVFGDLATEELALLNSRTYVDGSRGVGYHHAGLASIVKEFVEYLFLNKYIKFLATETLALGINMPAKAIFIDRLHKYDGIKPDQLLSQSFCNLVDEWDKV